MKLFHFLMPVLVAFSVTITSCGSGKKGLPNISGKPGETLIVISPKLWESAVGKQLRVVMAQPQLGLPQDEPVLKLVDVPKSAFKPIFHNTRNLVFVDVMSTIKKSKIEFQRDVWAHKQAVVRMKAQNEEELLKLFNANSDKIVSFFLNAEKRRLMQNYSKFNTKEVDRQLQELHKFSLKVAPGFQIHKDTTDFVWMSYETPSLSQGIIVNTFKYEDDSTFTKKFLVNKFDKVLSENIPGPLEGSFMKTEDVVQPTLQAFKLKNNYAVEMRGLWEVENDFMGGPYVALAVLDPKRNRVVTLFAYLYAPKQDKRNYLRQLEAMIYSLTFKDQAHNDKLYKQASIGEIPINK